MRISYDVKGPKRKELARAVAEEVGAEPKYLGAPSFAYEVGGYLVERDGTLQGPDNHDLVADLQGLHSFVSETEQYDTPLPEPAEVPGDLRIPYNAEMGGNTSPYADYDEPPAYDGPEQSLTIEVPREGFTGEALENVDKLVVSKASLIKKAIGAKELPIIRTSDTIQFPWFRVRTSEDCAAYQLLVEGICNVAKKRKRITAKDKPVPNEKFAFRVFLIQLGFVGDEYKVARKVLLKNLTGNSAFRDGVPAVESDE